MSAGLLRGLDRVTVTRLSFFLSVPALTAAAILQAVSEAGAISAGVGWPATLTATAVSFVVAYAAVSWLLRFISHAQLHGLHRLPGRARHAGAAAGRHPASSRPRRVGGVATVLLVRHGLTALTGPVLAGHTPGVHLDDRGRAQAEALAGRLGPVPLAAVVTSPLERCVETAGALVAGRDGLVPEPDDRLGEVRYGDWTGRPLRELTKEPLWTVVQQHPSAAVFPGPEGEGLAQTQARAVAAVREWDARVAAASGPDAVWLACSHGDVIKALLADALGLHLDLFQRISSTRARCRWSATPRPDRSCCG